MKQRFVPLLVMLLALPTSVGASMTNPLQKVVQLITELQGKVISSGEKEKAAYNAYYEWCDDASATKTFEVKSASEEKARLESIIEKATSDAEDASTQIEQLIEEIRADEQRAKEAAEIRLKEHSDFESSVNELTEAITALEKAIGVLDQTQDSGVSLAQVTSNTRQVQQILAGLAAVVDAVGLGDEDDKTLSAFLEMAQHRANRQVAGAPAAVLPGSPAAAAPASSDVYEATRSASIIEILENMKEKADGKLSELRDAEENSQHNYELLKKATEDKIMSAKRDLDEAKAAKAQAEESNGSAKGDLAVTLKQLDRAKKTLEDVQADCMEKAADHETTLKGQAEELKSLAEAKKLVQETTGAAGAQTYSLLQLASSSTMHLCLQAVDLIQHIARQQRSEDLSQLASRISMVYRFSTAGGRIANSKDPFVKVKQLVAEMIEKLEREAEQEADEKAYCDEEMAKTEEKHGNLQDDVDSLTTQIDKADAASTKLKSQVKELQAQMARLKALQNEAEKLRQTEHANYLGTHQDVEEGLVGVRAALKILQEYYARASDGESLLQSDTDTNFDSFMQQPSPPERHEKSVGAGAGIIGILQVIESDFAKELAELETEEDDSQTIFDKNTHDYEVTSVGMEQDVKYKSQEYTTLDKNIADLSGDLDTSSEELSAVVEYFEKVKDRCVAKPETYQERRKRREAELKGLQEALSILEGQAA